MYWGSSIVQVSFIKANRMRNWDQNDFRFISKILKFYQKHRKKSGSKQSRFYLQVNSMKKRQFLFTALLLVPRINNAWTTEQWSPPFLAPGMDRCCGRPFFHRSGYRVGWGHGFCMIQKYYTDCVLYFYYYYISCSLDHQVLDPRGWRPLT